MAPEAVATIIVVSTGVAMPEIDQCTVDRLTRSSQHPASDSEFLTAHTPVYQRIAQWRIGFEESEERANQPG